MEETIKNKNKGTFEDKIKRAIENKTVIRFTYENKERIGQPYILGLLKTNKKALRLYQTKGDSETRNLPDWGLFFLSKVKKLESLDETFNKSAKGYNPNDTIFKTIIKRV